MTSTNLERKVVNIFNEEFKCNNPNFGIAFRMKEGRWTQQYIDVLCDGLFYLGIECKSLKNTYDKLYFSSHFHIDADGNHQIDNITNFLNRSGRAGFLFVELRGRPRSAIHIIDWPYLLELWHGVDDEKETRKGKGISKENIKDNPLLSYEVNEEYSEEKRWYVKNNYKVISQPVVTPLLNYFNYCV